MSLVLIHTYIFIVFQNPHGYFCANGGFPALNDWQNSVLIKRDIIKPVILYTITNSEKPFCGKF